MPITYPRILEMRRADEVFEWNERDCLLYALGIGFGADPLNEQELPFVYERNLRAVPTMVAVIAHESLSWHLGLDVTRILHGEQAIVFHRPLRPEGRALARTRVEAVYDKGAEKGAVVITTTRLFEIDAETELATLTTTIMARGDGGFGGPAGGPAEARERPTRPADVSVTYETRPDQALLYRLSGDRNPLHADPAAALAVGFERPILHGLCSFGMGCRAVLQAFADYDPSRICTQKVRFASPVYPGEALRFDLWRDGNEVSFEAHVPARGVLALSRGSVTLV